MFRGFTRGRRGGRIGGNRQNLGVLLLALQIFQFGIDRIPIVTLVTLLTNIGEMISFRLKILIRKRLELLSNVRKKGGLTGFVEYHDGAGAERCFCIEWHHSRNIYTRVFGFRYRSCPKLRLIQLEQF